jgi:hypothetical protein
MKIISTETEKRLLDVLIGADMRGVIGASAIIDEIFPVPPEEEEELPEEFDDNGPQFNI